MLKMQFANCFKFYFSLRSRKGKRIVWKPQDAQDDQGHDVQFFVDLDKNASMVRREVLTKAVLKLCQDKFDLDIFASRPDGALFVDRKLLGTVHITGESSARLDWNTSVCLEYQCDYIFVEEQFKALLPSQGLSSS